MIRMLAFGLINENCVFNCGKWFDTLFLTGDPQSTSTKPTQENVLLTSQRDSEMCMGGFI